MAGTAPQHLPQMMGVKMAMPLYCGLDTVLLRMRPPTLGKEQRAGRQLMIPDPGHSPAWLPVPYVPCHLLQRLQAPPGFGCSPPMLSPPPQHSPNTSTPWGMTRMWVRSSGTFQMPKTLKSKSILPGALSWGRPNTITHTGTGSAKSHGSGA